MSWTEVMKLSKKEIKAKLDEYEKNKSREAKKHGNKK